MKGVVYTETVVHVPPAWLADQAPYQVVIVDLANGSRVTGRMARPVSECRAAIGDPVELFEERDGVPLFRPAAPAESQAGA